MSESGGIKRYLYAGTRGETEEEQPTFSPRASEPCVPVDLESVWSIRKNIPPMSSASHGGLNHNVNKGYYSRHGAMKDAGKTSKPPEKSDLGSAWAPSRGGLMPYSYPGDTGGSGATRTSSRNPGGPAGPLDEAGES